MDRSIPMLLIGLVFGGGIGFVVAAGQGFTLDGHDHGVAGQHMAHDSAGPDNDSGSHAQHGHGEPLSLAAGPDAPTLEIALMPDPDSGWNLHVMTTGFRFAPQNAGKPHVPGEGHAHVYVNGKKIARLYGPWMHIAALPGGAATLEVTLNANDHRPLAVEGEPLAARISVNVP
jgi:hypothetical protein